VKLRRLEPDLHEAETIGSERRADSEKNRDYRKATALQHTGRERRDEDYDSDKRDSRRKGLHQVT
jgi:hypothetical protein